MLGFLAGKLQLRVEFYLAICSVINSILLRQHLQATQSSVTPPQKTCEFRCDIGTLEFQCWFY